MSLEEIDLSGASGGHRALSEAEPAGESDGWSMERVSRVGELSGELKESIVTGVNQITSSMLRQLESAFREVQKELEEEE